MRATTPRERHFWTTCIAGSFTVIALGPAALVDILPYTNPNHASVGFKEVFAAGAAIIAALDLTFDLSNRAREHSLMKR